MRSSSPLLAAAAVLLAACGADGGGSGEIERIPLDREASVVVAGDGQVYVGNGVEQTIQRVDPKSGKAGDPLPVTGAGSLITDMVIGGGSVWVRDEHSVKRVDATSGRVVATIELEHSPNGIAWSEQGVWTAGNGQATRIDPRTNRAGEAIDTPALSEDIAIEAGIVWLPGNGGDEDGYVERITADEGQVNTQPLTIGVQPGAVGSGGGFVFFADEQEEALRKVDARTGEIVGRSLPLGTFPSDVEVGPEGVFVLGSDAIVRVDPTTMKETERIPLTTEIDDMAVGEGYLWMAEAGTPGVLARVKL